MTNDLNDHFPRSLRSSLAEVLKTTETIGTIFFPCPAHLAIALTLHFVACQSKKRANIWGMFTACFCSPSSRTSCLLFCENPQVTFASLSSPAVMDIRPLRGRSSLAEVFSTTIRFPCLCSLLAEVLTTIETIGTIFSLFGYLHFL